MYKIEQQNTRVSLRVFLEMESYGAKYEKHTIFVAKQTYVMGRVIASPYLFCLERVRDGIVCLVGVQLGKPGECALGLV